MSVFVWVDEDCDALSDVHFLLAKLKLHVQEKFTMQGALKEVERQKNDDVVILLDLICPLGAVAPSTRAWAQESLRGEYRGWYGTALLKEHPDLAARTVILSIVDDDRVRLGLQELGLPDVKFIFTKPRLYSSRSLFESALSELTSSAAPGEDKREPPESPSA